MLFCSLSFFFFFFKQKTAYEMRISDWSSDVCSSDLPVAAFDQYMLSLIVFARLIQISVQELASDINDRLDGSTNRGAIDVNVEHTHKNRNARHLFVAQPFWTKQFPWRRDVLDERDEPISGRDDQIFIARCHTYRIAEKCKHPNCQYDQGPCQPRHEKPRKHRNRGRNPGKFAPFRMNGWKAPFDAALGCSISVFWCHCR